MTTTVVPSSGVDAGQATVHWFKFNAVGTNTITLADQGNIGGEDVASATYTFFPSAAYGTEWRVYKRDAANDQYIQLSPTDTLQAGLGYWIKTKASGGGTITVGSSTSLGNPQADVPLDSSSTGRYNLVGHPFVFDVCWKDVQVVDGANVLSLDEADPLVGGNRACSLSTPDPSCVMSHTMGQWNGAAYQSYDGGTPGLEGVLSSFEGLWVQAFKSGIQLRIPVKRGAGDPCATVTGNSSVSAQATTLQDAEAERSASEPLAATATEQKAAVQPNKRRYSTPSTRRPEEWGLRLIVEADGLVDPGNLLGRLRDSVAGLDQHVSRFSRNRSFPRYE